MGDVSGAVRLMTSSNKVLAPTPDVFKKLVEKLLGGLFVGIVDENSIHHPVQSLVQIIHKRSIESSLDSSVLLSFPSGENWVCFLGVIV